MGARVRGVLGDHLFEQLDGARAVVGHGEEVAEKEGGFAIVGTCPDVRFEGGAAGGALLQEIIGDAGLEQISARRVFFVARQIVQEAIRFGVFVGPVGVPQLESDLRVERARLDEAGIFGHESVGDFLRLAQSGPGAVAHGLNRFEILPVFRGARLQRRGEEPVDGEGTVGGQPERGAAEEDDAQDGEGDEEGHEPAARGVVGVGDEGEAGHAVAVARLDAFERFFALGCLARAVDGEGDIARAGHQLLDGVGKSAHRVEGGPARLIDGDLLVAQKLARGDHGDDCRRVEGTARFFGVAAQVEAGAVGGLDGWHFGAAALVDEVEDLQLLVVRMARGGATGDGRQIEFERVGGRGVWRRGVGVILVRVMVEGQHAGEVEGLFFGRHLFGGHLGGWRRRAKERLDIEGFGGFFRKAGRRRARGGVSGHQIDLQRRMLGGGLLRSRWLVQRHGGGRFSLCLVRTEEVVGARAKARTGQRLEEGLGDIAHRSAFGVIARGWLLRLDACA